MVGITWNTAGAASGQEQGAHHGRQRRAGPHRRLDADRWRLTAKGFRSGRDTAMIGSSTGRDETKRKNETNQLHPRKSAVNFNRGTSRRVPAGSVMKAIGVYRETRGGKRVHVDGRENPSAKRARGINKRQRGAALWATLVRTAAIQLQLVLFRLQLESKKGEYYWKMFKSQRGNGNEKDSSQWTLDQPWGLAD